MSRIETTEIEKLARLARINVTDEEKTRLRDEFEEILGYISQIQELESASISSGGEVSTRKARTALREDEVSHEPGEHTETLLSLAPRRKGQYVEVKKIL